MEYEKKILGSCPHCGEQVVDGKYGPYCMGRCGMSVSRYMGKNLNAEEVKTLLEGGEVLVRGIVSRKTGNAYDVYIKPKTVVPYKYTKKDGTEASGFQWDFERRFPDRKENSEG